MDRAMLASFGSRVSANFKHFWGRVRRLKFRQVMGLVVIVKTFNPLLFLLALALFAFLLVKDIQEQYRPALDMISTNYNAIINQDLKGLQDAVDTAKGALKTLGDFLGVLKSVVNGIVGFVNAIIGAIAWFFGLGKINFNIQLPIPDFSVVFQPFNDLMLHVKGLFDGVGELFSATLAVLVNLWDRFKVFFFLAVGWVLLSIFASAYSEVSRGLEMIRGGPKPEPPDFPQASTALKNIEPSGRRLDTPPILIADHVLISLPFLLDHERGGSPGGLSRTFGYQERYLLSTQAVWPDRHVPLFYYQLADHVDAGVWAIFWQSLIDRGLNPSGVQMVISADTGDLAPSVRHYLPQAELQQSVETTIISR